MIGSVAAVDFLALWASFTFMIACVVGAVFVGARISQPARLAKEKEPVVSYIMPASPLQNMANQAATKANLAAMANPFSLSFGAYQRALGIPAQQSAALSQKQQFYQMLLQAGLRPEDYAGIFDDPSPPSPVHLAVHGLRKIAQALPMFPDQSVPNTMGFRAWHFDAARGALSSPHTQALWPDAELHCETWDESEVIRGVAGIHAHLVPHCWQSAPSGVDEPSTVNLGPILPLGRFPSDRLRGYAIPAVTGIVERFGRFVLGTEGWRAEWVVIRKLHAPNRAVAAALREIYPEVEISHAYR